MLLHRITIRTCLKYRLRIYNILDAIDSITKGKLFDDNNF